MTKLIDEQIHMMLEKDAQDVKDAVVAAAVDLGVSRPDIYRQIHARSKRSSRSRFFLTAIFFAGVAVGAPILEAAPQLPPAGPPKVIYQVPGVKTKITRLSGSSSFAKTSAKSGGHSVNSSVYQAQ